MEVIDAGKEAAVWESIGRLQCMPPSGVPAAGPATNELAALPFLTARDFIVAYGGVLCLVFTGFPSSIQQLKEGIGEEGPRVVGPSFSNENMGSKWAKVTLAALDHVNAPPVLDAASLAPRLLAVCRRFAVVLATLGPLPVPAVTQVRFLSRDLSRRVSTRDVPLLPVPNAGHVAAPQFTDAVVAEFAAGDNAVKYCDVHWNARRTTTHRYEEVLCVPEHTLVIDLASITPGEAKAQLLEVLRQFRLEVDSIFGDGIFKWFDTEHLHCTVRAL